MVPQIRHFLPQRINKRTVTQESGAIKHLFFHEVAWQHLHCSQDSSIRDSVTHATYVVIVVQGAVSAVSHYGWLSIAGFLPLHNKPLSNTYFIILTDSVSREFGQSTLRVARSHSMISGHLNGTPYCLGMSLMPGDCKHLEDSACTCLGLSWDP